jgi:hypothetical protein
MDKLMELMVRSFNLYKKQSTAEALIKKGELISYERTKSILENQIKIQFLEKERSKKNYKDDETSMKKFNIDDFKESSIYISLQYINSSIFRIKNELLKAEAIENVIDKLDNDLENNLRSLDLLDKLSNKETSKDIEIRLSSRKCALKRPGKVKFPCDNELVTGEQYCKEHLKQFKPERYIELFEKGE